MPSQSKEDTYAYYYHTNYIRNARAIAIAWAIFTFCFAIIMVVVFVQPYWIGDGPDALGTGYFGLYSGCISVSLQGGIQCAQTNIFDFDQIANNTMLITATTFVGVAVILTLLSILLMLLFLCKVPSTATVFNVCGALQILTGVCLLIGILVYPAGWEGHSRIQMLCGGDISYLNKAGCELRWVFYLAIIAVFDAIILGVLALILANKQDKLHEDMHFSDYYQPKGKFSEKKKRSKKGSLRSSIFNSYPTHASETYVNRDDQTRSNGNPASLDRRSVGSADQAASTTSDVRTRGSSRNPSSHTADRGSNREASSSDTRSRDRGGEEPDYASVTPRSQRSNRSNGSAVANEDAVSTHSTHSARSARSGNSKASTKSGKSGRAHDVVY